MYKNGFSIITVTNRDYCIKNMINNFFRQEFRYKELIVVINKDSINIEDIYKHLDEMSNVSVYKLPESTSLGTCLNFGIKKSKFNTISKFDDDDYYSPYYLDEINEAFIKEGCSVVGKQKIYYYLEKYKKLMLVKRSIENDYSKYIMGSTISFKKEVFDKVKFRDISIREDYYFNIECLKNGYNLYSTSSYNYMAFKHAKTNKHTFKVDLDALMNKCELIKSKIEFEDCFDIINKKSYLI